jgi:hypothetical protein
MIKIIITDKELKLSKKDKEVNLSINYTAKNGDKQTITNVLKNIFNSIHDETPANSIDNSSTKS